MRPFFYVILGALIVSCSQKPSLEYKYSDKEQTINCQDQNNNLLNEALYSFEQDILDYSNKETKTLTTAYGQFLYKGVSGTASYSAIANDHSLAVRDQLLNEDILIANGIKSNLNYAHPAVQCILEGIEDVAIKKTINSLLEVNSMDPTLFNSRLRNFGSQSQRNRNQALYVALDSYYQNLVGITLEEPRSNE